MEQHRARIEADHNNGIPRREWERMEQIIDGFLRDNDLQTCADAYGVSVGDLDKWIARRKAPKPKLRMSIQLPRTVVAMRIHRGWDAIEAETAPVMSRQQRARAAAFARWSDHG